MSTFQELMGGFPPKWDSQLKKEFQWEWIGVVLRVKKLHRMYIHSMAKINWIYNNKEECEDRKVRFNMYECDIYTTFLHKLRWVCKKFEVHSQEFPWDEIRR